jgi:hypothetical protein
MRAEPLDLKDDDLSTATPKRGIEACLHYIRRHPIADLRLEVLDSLATMVREDPATAELLFCHKDGMDGLQKILWEADRSQLPAAFEIFLALIEPRKSGIVSLVLISEGFENCIDAILIRMQSYREDEIIQTWGCALFNLLARESTEHSKVDDGTGSGAVLAVVTAMEAHMNSTRVQIYGIQALCGQCLRSRNAERNKQALVGLTLESGITACQIVQKVLLLATFTPELADPVCSLYRSLSASPSVVRRLSPASDVLRSLLSLIRVLQGNPSAGQTIEAALAALANLTGSSSSHQGISMNAAVSLTLDLMSLHSDNIDLQTQARRFVAIALPMTKDVGTFVQSGSVATIFTSILGSSLRESEVLDGVRILKCFIDLSTEARNEFLRFQWHPHMEAILARFRSSTSLHVELCYLLLKALDCDDLTWDQAKSVVGLTCQTMSFHPDSEGVQAAGCRILSDVARKKTYSSAVADSRALHLVALAMERFRLMKAIHLNGCFIFWKAARAGPIGNIAVPVQQRCLDVAFTSVQIHITDCQICEMGFSAIWGLIYESDRLQAQLANMIQGGEVLSRALVLYASVPGFLEKANGILASLCSNSPDRAANLVTSSAVEAVVNVMIHNRRDPTLHHLCIMYVKCALAAKPWLSTEGCLAVTSVIQALNASRDNDDIQHCTCLLLWILSQSSSDSKRMIMEAAGYDSLVETFKMSNNPDVRDAACLALNELLPDRSIQHSLIDTIS